MHHQALSLREPKGAEVGASVPPSRLSALVCALLLGAALSMTGCDPYDVETADDEYGESGGVGTETGASGADAEETEGRLSSARADLESPQGSPVEGTVELMKRGDSVMIAAEVRGLEPGRHGLHIHETGECIPPSYDSAGSHFNPTGVEHGAPNDPVHHAGDLGNLEVGEDGVATLRIERSDLALDESERSVLGRAVIVHAQPDDMETQPSGNAGDPIACGVIRPQGDGTGTGSDSAGS